MLQSDHLLMIDAQRPRKRRRVGRRNSGETALNELLNLLGNVAAISSCAEMVKADKVHRWLPTTVVDI